MDHTKGKGYVHTKQNILQYWQQVPGFAEAYDPYQPATS